MIMSTYKKICISNRYLVKGDFFAQIEEVLKGDIDRIILREKDLSPQAYEEMARRFLSLCEAYHKIPILHSFTDIAIRLSCPYIHLGFPDFMKLSQEKKAYFQMIGVSTHSLEEAVTAEKMGVDYITASHIFSTRCKEGLAPKGLEFLRAVCAAVEIDVYALGGINSTNYQQCLEAGAAGICMMSQYMCPHM